MLCQNCSKREATTHIKRVVNGEWTENHLCSECASSLGYDDIFDNSVLSIPNIFASFFGDTPLTLASGKTQRCEKCGSSFEDIIRTGMVGCADCYEKFSDKLLPSIQRIHGKAKHAGKVPVISQSEPIKKIEKSKEEIIAEKEAELSAAVEKQEFERAVVLRDEIKALKEEN